MKPYFWLHFLKHKQYYWNILGHLSLLLRVKEKDAQTQKREKRDQMKRVIRGLAPNPHRLKEGSETEFLITRAI